MADGDRADQARWLALTSPDPRVHVPKYRPRMRLYSDELPTLAELGAELEDFCFPEER